MFILTFKTVTDSLFFENILGKEKVELLPVPRALGSSCGFACKVHFNSLEELEKIIEEKETVFSELYEIDNEHSQPSYRLIKKTKEDD